MDWGSFIGPAVVAAAVSGVVTTIGFLVNRSTTLKTHQQKIEADKELAERRFTFDKDLAERKATLDARASDRKRRQDLAEELIAGFYEINDIMRSVRSALGYEGEGSTRQKGENETPEDTKRLNKAFVVTERFNRHREQFAKIMSREYRAVAWFGADINRPFSMAREALNEVFIASEMLAETERYPATTQEDRDMRLEWRRTIWATNTDKDKIAAKLREALQLVEATCRPVLQEPMS